MPGSNGSKLPAADDLIQPAWRTGSKSLPLAKGQIVHAIGGYQVGHVEVRVAAADPEIPNVTNETANNGIGDGGDIVNGMAKRVIELKLQAA